MPIETPLVILYLGKPALTAKCVRSVLEAGYPLERILCLDNGSPPDVGETLAESFPGLRQERLDENRGYSGGFNAAVRGAFETGADAAFFLSNDAFPSPGAVEVCEKAARAAGAGLVAPLVTSAGRPEKIQSIGGYFSAENAMLHHHTERNLPPLLTPGRDYVPGSAFWISRAAFETVGGMDETFHSYWEDVDFSFRAQEKGVRLARCEDARAAHDAGRTCYGNPLFTTFYFQRNRARFCARHLAGAARETAFEAIRRDWDRLERRWKEKDDRVRLGYLSELRKELEKISATGHPGVSATSCV